MNTAMWKMQNLRFDKVKVLSPTNYPILSGSCRIGGAVPIVFSFFAEVLSREKRGEHLSWLCMFWMIGEIYASAMAWAIIPHYGEFIC